MNRREVAEYVSSLNETDAKGQLERALFKLAAIRRAPLNSPVGAVIDLADHTTEVQFG